jgi:hypothetical protein
MWFKKYKADIAWLLLLQGIILLLFWKAVTLQGIFYSGDIRLVDMPFRWYTAHALKQGISLYWNPLILCGYPYASDFLAGVFYPFTYLFFCFLPPHAAINYFIIFHYMLCGLGMFLYARTLGISSLASFCSALLFTFCGFNLGHFGHINILCVVVYLPFILLFLELDLQHEKWIYCVIAGFIIGMNFLTGHSQMVIFISMLVCLYYLFSPATIKNSQTVLKLRTRLWRILLFAMVGIGFASPMIFPMRDIMSRSWRANGLPLENLVQMSVPPIHQIRLLLPFVLGRPYDMKNVDLNFVETCGYIGIFSLWIILYASLFYKKSRHQIFFLWIGLVGLIFTFGKYIPFFGLARYIPILNYTRSPGRLYLYFDFSLAILTGFSLDRILTNGISISDTAFYKGFREILGLLSLIIIIFGIFFFLNYNSRSSFLFTDPRIADNFLRCILLGVSTGWIWLWMKGKLTSGQFRGVAVVLIVVDMFSFGQVLNLDANKAYPLDVFYHKPDTLQVLQNDTSTYRIYSYYSESWESPHYIPIDRETLHCNIGLYYGVSSFQNYNVSGTWRFLQIMGPVEEPWVTMSKQARAEELRKRIPVLAMTNVKYILTADNLDIPELKLIYDKKVRIYEISSVLPRAYFVTQWVNAQNQNEAVKLFLDPQFDPRKYAITENYSGPAPINSPNENNTKITFQEYSPTKVLINCETHSPGLFILADYNYPGWKAKLDGQATPIYRANFLFRGIYLTPGSHTIEFQYYPVTYEIGYTIAAITLLVILVGIFIAVRRNGFKGLFR